MGGNSLLSQLEAVVSKYAYPVYFSEVHFCDSTVWIHLHPGLGCCQMSRCLCLNLCHLKLHQIFSSLWWSCYISLLEVVVCEAVCHLLQGFLFVNFPWIPP
jgi:hypothetical protein